MRSAFHAAARAAALLVGLGFAGSSLAEVAVQGAWLRATPPGVAVGAGYGTLSNNGEQAQKIVRIETAIADHAMIHVMSHENGMMKMREAGDVTVPAKGSLALVPGHGHHLMLMGLKQPLVEGQSVPVTFVFGDGSQVKVDFAVRASAP